MERRTVWLELLRFVVAADELFRTEEEELVAVVERVEEVEEELLRTWPLISAENANIVAMTTAVVML